MENAKELQDDDIVLIYGEDLKALCARDQAVDFAMPELFKITTVWRVGETMTRTILDDLRRYDAK